MDNIIKQIIKFITNEASFFLTRLNKRKIFPNTILLVRVDSIGDYVLFRNFIKILKDKYPNYSITFVGNEVYKDLAEFLDKKYINEFIWINRKKFEKNFFYRVKKLKEILNKGYEVVINPTYSRNFYADDAIVRAVFSKEKIGSIGDLTNLKSWQKFLSDKYYTKLIFAKDDVLFEFYRNKEFFENLFEERFSIKKPQININFNSNFNYDNYAVLFIGASARFRKWDIKNFVKVGEFLSKKGYNIIICGGNSDIEDAKKFKEYSNYTYIDLVGKTSLIDFVSLLSKASILVSNETSAPHIAVALNLNKIFVISNGNHFGRFTPYPKEISSGYYPIYPLEIEKNMNNYELLVNKYGKGSNLDINSIDYKRVIEIINKVI